MITDIDKHKRAQAIEQAIKDGTDYHTICFEFKLSRSRIYQILQEEHLFQNCKTLRSLPTMYAVYNYIVDYKTQHDGCSPTIREIIDNAYLGSCARAVYILHCLEKDGMIKIRGTHHARSIEIIGSRWIPPQNNHQ